MTTNNHKQKVCSAFILAMAIIGLSMSAHATLIGSITSDGVTWTLNGDTVAASNGGTGSFTLDVDATGWDLGGTAYLTDFSIKNFKSATTGSNLSVTSGIWDSSFVNEGLNSMGCKSNGPTPDALCTSNSGAVTSGPSTGSMFSFTFDLALAGAFPDTVHLKVRWADSTDKKVGDLISQDFNGDVPDVPEPGTLALVGLGLFGIGLGRRKIKAA